MTRKKTDRLIIFLCFLWLLLTFMIYMYSRSFRQEKDAVDGPVDLKTWFNSYNEEYFLGALPQNTIVSYGNIDDMGITFRENDVFHIVIDLKTNRAGRVAMFTELHEMCHESQWNLHEAEVHGPKFQSCMHRLADLGAFDNLW